MADGTDWEMGRLRQRAKMTELEVLSNSLKGSEWEGEATEDTPKVFTGRRKHH